MSSETASTLQELQAENERLRRELDSLRAADALRRKSRALLEAERNAFRAVFDESPIMQVWFDRNGKVLRANKAAQAVAGSEYPPQDFTIYSDPQLIMLGVPDYFDKALTGQTVCMPRYAFNASRTHEPAPDVDRILETVLYPVFAANGTVDSVIVQHFDVTDLAHAQAQVHPRPMKTP